MVIQEQVDDGILQDGSNLSGVTSQCVWQEISERELMGEHSDDDADSNYNASMQLSSKQQLPAKSNVEYNAEQCAKICFCWLHVIV